MCNLIWTILERKSKTVVLLSGRGRSWIAGLAGISGLGPNSEPRGNNRSFPETRERARAPVKKIGSRDSIFGLVNSTYFFKKTNHNQYTFNIKYLANFIKKYWTCFRCQKRADFLVCFPPSVKLPVYTTAPRSVLVARATKISNAQKQPLRWETCFVTTWNT